MDYEIKPLPGGKWTFFLIDIDENRVVESWTTQPDKGYDPGDVHRAAALARKTGHRYSIAQSQIFIGQAPAHRILER